MKKTKFFEKMQKTSEEREVEDVYNEGVSYYFRDSSITHPYKCDGYLEQNVTLDNRTRTMRLLVEYKYLEDFSLKSRQAVVLVQVLFYMKRFELDGMPLPNIILVGDKTECFIVHSNDIIKYLDDEVDWSKAPSEAPHLNPELVLKISRDENINPFVFEIKEDFKFSEVAIQIREMALYVQRLVRVTEHNIAKIYDYFINRVVKDANKYTANDLVYMFIDLMVTPKENYKHPTKKNTLVLSNKNEVLINGSSFDSFFNHFERNYTPSEKEVFTEIADRLIEDTTRRFKGEFYTPTIWVDEAHKMISQVYGDDWKDKFVVWDCAWGTGNLTRDYNFKELYCSTLNEGDLTLGARYNNNAIKFQYDFLNDDNELILNDTLEETDLKLPTSLLNSLKADKPLLFLINPPYGTANNRGNTDGDHKSGIALTGVNSIMKKDNFGACSQQLYAQFLYKILKFKEKFKLSNVAICVFAKSTYMTGGSFSKFREIFLNEFKYECGMLFQASHFADVKGVWGVDFAIWSSGETSDKTNFIHTLKDLDGDNQIISTGTKTIYNLDGMATCSDWIKSDVEKMKTFDAPQMTNALFIKPCGRGKIVENAIGYYVNVSNTVYENSGNVFITSSCAAKANGISIIPDNFKKVVSNFAARKLISGKYANWINDKDEYMIPNINDSRYDEWISDSIIYSIFNTSSAQSSLRNVEYANKKWNIENQFFFMDKKEMAYLADEFENDDVYLDIKNFNKDRYVYTILQNMTLSIEAQNVLDKAKDLVRSSFKYRDLFNEDKPEYNINTWDAGWYQIKGLLNEYMKDGLMEFNELYKKLENKMRPMVYELGFLKE